MKIIIPVIFKHTVEMFHGTISWKIKSSFYRDFEKNKRTVTGGIGDRGNRKLIKYYIISPGNRSRLYVD